MLTAMQAAQVANLARRVGRTVILDGEIIYPGVKVELTEETVDCYESQLAKLEECWARNCDYFLRRLRVANLDDLKLVQINAVYPN